MQAIESFSSNLFKKTTVATALTPPPSNDNKYLVFISNLCNNRTITYFTGD